jgi:Ca2+-transporting ATPase
MMQGLTSAEAVRRLTEFGYNELGVSRPKNILKIALEVVREPMFLLLITCGTLYLLLGDYKEGIILLCTIFIIIFITFYQYRKTERALEALRKLSSPRSLVIRDGIEVRIPGREVVPGDLMVLHEGDRISADGTLLDATHLMIDESLLTGESVPVIKTPESKGEAQSHFVFSGTLVVHGSGKALVAQTGDKTKFGLIGASLGQLEQEETRLQKEMKLLIKKLFIIGIVVSIGVILLYYYTRGNFLQSLINGLAASIAILPEEFPVILTVFMALGAWRLSKKNVLTRRPSAIESLGAATVLCSDKTGTITLNKMEVAAIYDGHQICQRENFSASTQSIRHTLAMAHLATPEDSIDPMEQAIQLAFHGPMNTIDKHHKLIREYPWSHDFFAMSRIVDHPEIPGYITAAKGAPETIFSMCHLEPSALNKHMEAVNELASLGFRVIGIASAPAQTGPFPEHQTGFQFHFEGLLAFEDPIRPEARLAIEECHQAGIRVIMMTGDYPATARNIAIQAGLPSKGKVITGEQLEQMDDHELIRKIRKTSVFARVVPEQKLRIVQALKANGEIVAMTGDGVNDAPALKASDIGIAMGNKGTDVAREASSLVLLDDHFASIVGGIRTGRRIFDNLQKAMSYVLAIHIPIIGMAMLPAFFPMLPVVMMPLHIVFLELIIDPVCSVAFESEQEEKGIMQRPPRHTSHKFFGGRRILFSLFQGALLLVMVLLVYFYTIYTGYTEEEIRAVTFAALIAGNIGLILTNLSRTRNLFAILAERNLALVLILNSAVFLLALMFAIPYLRDLFAFQFPGWVRLWPALAGAAVLVLILEINKAIRLSTHSK